MQMHMVGFNMGALLYHRARHNQMIILPKMLQACGVDNKADRLHAYSTMRKNSWVGPQNSTFFFPQCSILCLFDL